MRRFFATPLWLAALTIVLATAPLLQGWTADHQMTMAASDAVDLGNCKSCPGDRALPGVCVASCVIPLGVIAAPQPFVHSSAASFLVAPDQRLAGVSPLPDPPRPKRLLPA